MQYLHYFWNILVYRYVDQNLRPQENKSQLREQRQMTYHQQIPAVGTVALTHRVHSTVNTNSTRPLGHDTNTWTDNHVNTARRDCRRCRVFLNLAIVSPQQSGDHTTKYIRHNARCSPAPSVQVALRVLCRYLFIHLRSPNFLLPQMYLTNISRM